MATFKANGQALAAALYLALSSSAFADCGSLQPLVLIHDSYRAMVSGQRSIQTGAAIQITRDVPVYSADYFGRSFQSLKLDIDLVRLDTLMLDGYLLAGQLLGGARVDPVSQAKHKQNVDWLTGEIARTGCFREKSTAKGAPTAGLTLPKALTRAPYAALKSKVAKAKIDWRMVLGALVVAVGGFVIYLIYVSRPARIARVGRMPRETVALSVKVTHSKSQDRIILLDLSLGGAKVEWEGPPKQGEAISIDLPMGPRSGSIVWSNLFFAGVMFDDHLSLDEFDALIEFNGSATRSQLTNIV